jgi:hypothetical protein
MCALGDLNRAEETCQNNQSPAALWNAVVLAVNHLGSDVIPRFPQGLAEARKGARIGTGCLKARNVLYEDEGWLEHMDERKQAQQQSSTRVGRSATHERAVGLTWSTSTHQKGTRPQLKIAGNRCGIYVGNILLKELCIRKITSKGLACLWLEI